MIDQLLYYLEFPFVQYAIIVSVLVALCSALLGTTLVLRRFSFIGDSLSHVAFCITAVASVLNLSSKLYITIPGTILFTIFILNRKANGAKKNDSTLALISVSSLALGYIVMYEFGTGSNVSADVCTTLFGSTSILTLKQTDVIISVVLSIVTIVGFILLFNKIFAITFDENFARSSGVNVTRINLILSIIIGTVIVLAINLVGSLLITALIIFPAITSMKVFNNFKNVTICSVILSIITTTIGLLVSILYSPPVGSTIVVTDLVFYLLFTLISKVGGKTNA